MSWVGQPVTRPLPSGPAAAVPGASTSNGSGSAVNVQKDQGEVKASMVAEVGNGSSALIYADPSPPETEFPEGAIPNPSAALKKPQPALENIPSGTLYRPLKLPADLDQRLDTSSIWMGLEKGSNKAVYFVPSPCTICSRQSRYCDRGLPACSGCRARGTTPCEVQGRKWGVLKNKAKRPAKQLSGAHAHTSTASDVVRSANSSPVVPHTPKPNVSVAAVSAANTMVVAPRHSQSSVVSSGTSIAGVADLDQPRLTAAEKGKGRAVPVPSLGGGTMHAPAPALPRAPAQPAVTSSSVHAPVPGPASDTAPTSSSYKVPAYLNGTNGTHSLGVDADSELFAGTSGRGKRAKKKRRLSLDEEIDPETLDANGQLKRPKKRVVRPDTIPSTLSRGETDGPMDAVDEAYFARVKANAQRPALTDMTGTCPAWASTRRGLQAGVDCFRGARQTRGASLDIGVGGIVRAILLEGETDVEGTFWGTEKRVGSLAVYIGRPRNRRMPKAQQTDEPSSPPRKLPPGDPFHPAAHPVNYLPDIRMLDTETGTSAPVKTAPYKSALEPFDTREDEEIEALLLTQRARTPIVVAVTQDYAAVPFKVPRAVVVLGWFWLTDSWVRGSGHDVGRSSEADQQLEPVSLFSPDRERDDKRVQWKFRLEYVSTGKNVENPWWSRAFPAGRQWQDAWQRPTSTPFWDVSGPGIYGSPTLTAAGPIPANVGILTWKEHHYVCRDCNMASARVYQTVKAGYGAMSQVRATCLNEQCTEFFRQPSSLDDDARPRSRAPWKPDDNTCGNAMQQMWLPPETLGLQIVGAKPGGIGELAREGLGLKYWQGWVCNKCGKANERRRWVGWECDGCKHMIPSLLVTIPSADVRNNVRPPVATGPRQDNGFPVFPESMPTTSSWTVFDRIIKVVRHEVAQGAFEVQHALYARAEGPGGDLAEKVFKEMQVSPDKEIDFQRCYLPNTSRRPFEKYLCPYYTFQCGPETADTIASLPVDETSPWRSTPTPFLDAIEIINHRVGYMYDGQPEFNSMLVAVTPPAPVMPYAPTVTVRSATYVAFMMLGSECGVRLRRSSPSGSRVKRRGAEILMQHGDVLGVHAVSEDVEVEFKSTGFGMLCIAKQVYRETPEPGQGAIFDPSNAESRRDVEAQQLNNAKSAAAAAAGTSNAPPPKPTQYRPAPLLDWYIGSLPLDASQTEIWRRPMFTRSGSGEPLPTTSLTLQDTDTAAVPKSPKVLKPDVPPSPTAQEDDEEEEEEREVVKGKGRAKGKGASGVAASPAPSSASVPAPISTQGGRKKRQSEAGAGAGAGAGAAAVKVDSPSSRSPAQAQGKIKKPRQKRVSEVVKGGGAASASASASRGASPAGSAASSASATKGRGSVAGPGLGLGLSSLGSFSGMNVDGASSPASTSTGSVAGGGGSGLKVRLSKKKARASAGVGVGGGIGAGTEGAGKEDGRSRKKSRRSEPAAVTAAAADAGGAAVDALGAGGGAGIESEHGPGGDVEMSSS